MALSAIIFPDGQQFTGWHGEPYVSFENEAVYFALEPYIANEELGLYIDPYDGADLSGHDLDRLVSALDLALLRISQKEERWVERIDRWVQPDGKEYKIEYVADKTIVLNVINGLREFARRARRSGARLLFLGD